MPPVRVPPDRIRRYLRRAPVPAVPRALLLPLLVLAASYGLAAGTIPAGPCAERIEAVRPGSQETGPLLAAAACLREAERIRAPGAGAIRDTGDTGDSTRAGLDSSLSRLRRRLPASEPWYTTQLERLRSRRDVPRLRDMAWLATLRDPANPGVWREIVESHVLAGDVFLAGMALLRQAERDPAQSGYLQYQLENQIRSQAEQPASVLLDSLILGFRHRQAVTAEILESACWSNRHYPGAFVNTMAWLELKRPPPEIVLERASRYHAVGYFDYASAILDAAGWRAFPKPWQAMGRALFLRVRFQLEDWQAIAAEAAGAETGAAGSSLTEEERYLSAAAALRLGRGQDALARLQGLDAAGESPWGYRAQLLRSRALLSLGRLPEAARVLDALKRSPRRREGTGPILFWQGWLALQQGNAAAAESLLVLASAYTGDEESQKALEYRQYLLLDSGAVLADFLRGLAESPLAAGERVRALDRVPAASPLWPYARLEKAQILAGQGLLDSARAVLDQASRASPDRVLGHKAEAMAAFLQEKAPGGRPAALARYEDLLIEYQQGVIPEFSRGRIRALK